MGAEIGATCSVFPYDRRMRVYLQNTERGALASLADRHSHLLTADPETGEDPGRYYDRVIGIDLAALEPHVVGPHTPDLARPISGLGPDARSQGYVEEISAALIGSCTNSSYEDMSRVADLAEQARARGARSRIPLLVTPGSEQIRGTIQRDGQMQSLLDIGATVLANACGPCIGQWSRPELKEGEANTIVTSFNRNFPGRNDGRRQTLNFIASPEITIALALGGSLSFNPLTDPLTAADGTRFRLAPPAPAPEVPPGGFKRPGGVFLAPSADPDSVTVEIDPKSGRLQALEPFPAWDGNDLTGLHLMVKARGKCTTDHISPAGAWLSFRGHLDNLSDNMLLGAVNAFTGGVGTGANALTGTTEPFPQIARRYKRDGIRWVIVGDGNYGEGSSREHAAMTPRYLNCAAVIAKSFARIHETNLKKQGVLALTFADPADYDRVLECDRISIVGLRDLAPGRPVRCLLEHRPPGDGDGNNTGGGDASTCDAGDACEEILLNHSYNEAQIGWFRAGSALNVLKAGQ